MKMFSVDRTVFMLSAVKCVRVSEGEYGKELTITFLDGTRLVEDGFDPIRSEKYWDLCEIFRIDPKTGDPLI